MANRMVGRSVLFALLVPYATDSPDRRDVALAGFRLADAPDGLCRCVVGHFAALGDNGAAEGSVARWSADDCQQSPSRATDLTSHGGVPAGGTTVLRGKNGSQSRLRCRLDPPGTTFDPN